MLQPLPRRVVDIESRTITIAQRIAIGVQVLPLEVPLAAQRQVLEIRGMDDGVGVLVVDQGRYETKTAISGIHVVFVKHADHAEVPSGSGVDIAVLGGEIGIVLDGRQHAVADSADLAGRLGCAEQIGGLQLLASRQRHARWQVRRFGASADAPRVDDRQSRLPAGIRAARRVEDFLAFLEEQALLRKEGFLRRQVDVDVVGFDGTEIRIERCRRLEVRRWPPEQVEAGPRAVIAHPVECRRCIRE